jgi:hypothetical protein
MVNLVRKVSIVSTFLVSYVAVKRRHKLYQIDHGKLTPKLSTRIGAYYGTKGYLEGTIGNVTHHAVGTLYMIFGSIGEDDVGTLFNTPKAKALYPQPINSPATEEFNQLEVKYWETQHNAGGLMASMFTPSVRKWIEYQIFFKEYSGIIHVENWLRKVFNK